MSTSCAEKNDKQMTMNPASALSGLKPCEILSLETFIHRYISFICRDSDQPRH